MFFLHLLRTSIRASITLRGALFVETAVMVLSNLIFFSMWWIFFREFDDIRGWRLSDMAAAMAILSGSYGLSQICFGGVKDLGLTIFNGELDVFMTQPKNLLLHLAGSKSRSRGWGHVATMIILLILGGFRDSIPLVFLTTISGCLIFASYGVIIHSLTFWLGPIEAVSQKLLDSLFLFALYPSNIYSGVLQLVMFTLIPAGLIGYVPVELLRNFSWIKAAILLLSCSSFLALAVFVFHLGLKRYESGNRFGVR